MSLRVRTTGEHQVEADLSNLPRVALPSPGAVMRKEIQLAGVVFPHETLQYRYAFDM